MAIKAYSHVKAADRPEIAVGDWVCLDSFIRDGIAQKGGRVAKVTGQSVVVDEGHGAVRTKRKHNIAFVCDTEAEMERCAEVSSNLWRSLAKHAQDRKREAIEKLVGSKA